MENNSLSVHSSSEIVHRQTTSVSHFRSNTLPRRGQKRSRNEKKSRITSKSGQNENKFRSLSTSE